MPTPAGGVGLWPWLFLNTYSRKSQLQWITRLLIQVCVSWRNSHLGTRTPYILLPCILPSLILPALCILHSLFKVGALLCFILLCLAYLALFFLILLDLALSCFILLYLALSCFILLYLALSCFPLLYLALSCFSMLMLTFTCFIILYCFTVPCFIFLYLAEACFILPYRVSIPHLALPCLTLLFSCFRVRYLATPCCTLLPCFSLLKLALFCYSSLNLTLSWFTVPCFGLFLALTCFTLLFELPVPTLPYIALSCGSLVYLAEHCFTFLYTLL